ncbi:efflux RND transporter periplasmic adaptor subunit [Rubritalea marina]|uniref:efflux RND transporter periplasmic adaptor subunit n=1 Tax=Rubritalea marina TaxID=361055 RepID=UPI00036ABF39|nr:efflux RND transporter periplasmic adaptor subunit [Rubritalea marina]
MKKILKFLPAVVILGLGFAGWKLFTKKPSAENDGGKQSAVAKAGKKAKYNPYKNAIQTEVVKLKKINFDVTLSSHGIAAPSSITPLTPQVSGIIQSVSDHFSNGSFVKKGEVLVELNPSDFESQIATASANVAQAEAGLAQEQARAAQALRNWEDIGFDKAPNDLVLRKPQLKQAKANLAARLAAYELAKRNLERSKIRAPYDARVRSRDVGIGQSVGTGTKLGELYPTAFAEVRLPLSIRQLRKIDIDEINFSEVPVTLNDSLNNMPDRHWEATLVRAEGELDPNSRELFVVARVHDPFGIHGVSRKHPLRMNQPVTATIEAITLQDVVAIPRSALYGKDEIILAVDQHIKRETINILWSTIDYVYTDTPELDGKLLATTRLSFAAEGAPLRILNQESVLTNSSSKPSM